MDGFIRLVRQLLIEAGLIAAHVYCRPREESTGQTASRRGRKKRGEPSVALPTHSVLPGWFRAEKDWDLIVVANRLLVAVVEFKSQMGSFGNNFNNRTEESLGNATDLLAAYREGAFKPSARPWLGYLMLLEECPKSLAPVRLREPHFKVFDEFRNASYAKRDEILLTKLVRERLYDAACFLMSDRKHGLDGVYHEPSPELTFQNLAASLLARAIAVAKTS